MKFQVDSIANTESLDKGKYWENVVSEEGYHRKGEAREGEAIQNRSVGFVGRKQSVGFAQK